MRGVGPAAFVAGGGTSAPCSRYWQLLGPSRRPSSSQRARRAKRAPVKDSVDKSRGLAAEAWALETAQVLTLKSSSSSWQASPQGGSPQVGSPQAGSPQAGSPQADSTPAPWRGPPWLLSVCLLAASAWLLPSLREGHSHQLPRAWATLVRPPVPPSSLPPASAIAKGPSLPRQWREALRESWHRAAWRGSR